MSSSRRSCPVRFGLWSTALTTPAVDDGEAHRHEAHGPVAVDGAEAGDAADAQRGGDPLRSIGSSMSGSPPPPARCEDPAVSNYEQILVEQVDAVLHDHAQPSGEDERLDARR